ncbi:hypothetical protein Efla_003892 [Eimeria flavescens]
MPLYVRLKRHRDEPPPPFLCLLRPQKRQQLSNGGRAEASRVLERAVIFKHVDAATPPDALGCLPKATCVAAGFRQTASEPEGCDYSAVEGMQTRAAEEAAAEVSAGIQQTGVLPDERRGPPAAAVESSTFWSAFNRPLRADVFGGCEEAEAAASRPLAYRDAVEEAVKSLRRLRVANQQQEGTVLDGQGYRHRRDVVLLAGQAVPVLDVCQDGSSRAGAEASREERDGDEFEYDLYAIECEQDERCSWEQPHGVHKQRLLELLQQDASAVALVEVEDVDFETGLVTEGKGSMQVFLEEFGDIDDSDSDEEGEIDYPSGESSVEEGDGRRRLRRRWDSESSVSASSRSSQSEDEDRFTDEYF